MPQFDLVSRPVKMPNAVGGRADDSALRIQQQGRQALSEGVNKLAVGYNDMIKEQDSADMVASRSAVLRLKADEDAELSGISNPAKIKEIQEKYKTKYDDIIGGNEPLNDKPYFRNQSGKDSFNKNFMQSFHTQRYAQGKKLESDLQRRDTHAKYMNGIKSIIDQPNWNAPSAHKETDEYVNKLIEGGYYTAEEGKEFREITHTNLDIERANKMFSDAEALQYDEVNDGKMYQGVIDDYKKSVNDLDYLDQDQKNDYIKKADALFKQKKNATEVRKREIEADKKKAELDYDGKMTEQILRGQVPLSTAIDDPNLSQGYRNKLLEAYNKQTAEAKKQEFDQAKTLLSNRNKMIIERQVYNYDPANDRLNNYKQRTALQLAIIDNPALSAPEKANYQKILLEGLPLDESAKSELKSMEEQLTKELGTDVSLDKEGKLTKLQKLKGFEPETIVTHEGLAWDTKKLTGDVIKDGLNTNKRLEIYSNYMGRVRELMKRGKIDEARNVFSETMTALQKFDDDTKFYDEMRNNFVTTEIR